MTNISEEHELLAKMKLQPYFSVRLLFGSPADELTWADARKLVTDNVVSLRGWDFPHVGDTLNAGDYVACCTDWEQHVELWRMYRSSQFVFFANFWDVGFQAELRKELARITLATPAQKASVAGMVTFVGLIYALTEFYLFAGRIARARLIADEVEIRVVVHNVARWALAVGEPVIPWHHFHQARVNQIDVSRNVSATVLVQDAALAAVPAIKDLFSGFNWDNASPQMIKQWQERLLTGRFAF